MICKICKVMPSQVGKTLCLKCEKQQTKPISEVEELKRSEDLPIFPSNSVTDRGNVTGYLKSYKEVETTESIGLKLLKSILGREDFSFTNKVQHFQVRSSNQELVYVIFPGKVRKNLVLTEGNKVEVIGHRNRHNQLIARYLNDLDSNITYRTASFSYLVALFIVLIYLLLTGVVVWLYYKLFQTNIMAILIFAVLIAVPFKKSK